MSDNKILISEVNINKLLLMLNAAAPLSKEVILNFSKSGIYINLIDAANVCMMSAVYPSDLISNYNITEDLKLPINIEKILSVLKQAKNKDDNASIYFNKDKNKIEFSFGNIKLSTPLLDIDSIRKEPKNIKLDLPVDVILTTDDFVQSMKLCEKISENIKFATTETSLDIMATSNLEEIVYNIDKENMDIKSYKPDTKSMFDINYLTDIYKSLTSADNIEFRLGDNFPSEFNGVFDNGFNIKFILAPRVEEY